MKRIQFIGRRYSTYLIVTCLTTTALFAEQSPWQAKAQKSSSQEQLYSVDPDDNTVLTPSAKNAGPSAKDFKNSKESSDIDWDSVDTSSLDRVFESSSIPVEKTASFPKVKPDQRTKDSGKISFSKPVQEESFFQSLIAEEKSAGEEEKPQGATPATKEEVLEATKGPKSFISKGRVSRLSQDKLLAEIQESSKAPPKEEQTILINFNNVSIIEYIRFISRVSNKNFIFADEDLQFTVTIVSEEPTTLDNVLMALFQELNIRNLHIIEEGNTFLIHRSDGTRAPGKVVSDAFPDHGKKKGDLITRVFRLNITDASSVSAMIKPMLSDKAMIQVITDTNHIVVTDISSNIEKVMKLIKSVDAPNSSMVIGQYVVRNAYLDDLIKNAEQIMTSIARGQPITFVAHSPSNSIFIISAPFLVERAIPILQRLDQNDGTTGIFDLNELKYIPPSTQQEIEELEKAKERAQERARILREEGREEGPGVTPPQGFEEAPIEGIPQEGARVAPDGSYKILPDGTRVYQAPSQQGFWKLDANGNWQYSPVERAQPGEVRQREEPTRPPEGYWKQDFQNQWEFIKGAPPPEIRKQVRENTLEQPEGRWDYGSDNKWRFLLKPGASIFAGKRIRASQLDTSLPLGDIERTKFYIHKLQFRKGDSIQEALQQIGASLSNTQAINQDLIHAIESVQWLEPSNSLIVTGTPGAILKVKELIDEIDRPLRQVFIEMLVLDLAIDDAMDLGVTWANKFGGGDTAGAQAFIAGATPVATMLATSGVERTGAVVAAAASKIPDATAAIGTGGYTLGIVGQRISAGGTEFASISAFLKATHDKTNVNVILNPKIITEDNLPAEIFVGENTPFKTQSIANDEGSTITSNFEFKDVGATMKVTPFLGNSNIITMEIEYEQSSVIPGTNTSGGTSNDPIGPSTRINRTKTRIHMPDGYFLVISGMISSREERGRRHVPCLGGAPLIGAAFTDKTYKDEKRNLIIFIRPQIIDTEVQMDELTDHQQNIFLVKSRTKKMWKLDCEETMDWLNVIQTDPNNNENECCQENDIYPQRHRRMCR